MIDDLCQCPKCGRSHNPFNFGKPPGAISSEYEQLREQIARDEEHYQAAMAMSEKHRKLWVEASQNRDRLRAVLLQVKHGAEYPDELGNIIDSALASQAASQRGEE